MLLSWLLAFLLNETTSFIMGTIVSALGASLMIWLSERKAKKASASPTQPKPACDISATAHALFPRFSATLVHDLKQPISAIQFNALAALRFIQSSESGGHPAVTESLEDIKSDVARLSRLAQGLGAFLGVERGQDEVLDLNFEIETALSLLRGEMMKRQIQCQTQFSSIKPGFIWKRPIVSRTILSITLTLMDALVSQSDKSKVINVSTHETANGQLTILFQADSFTTKPSFHLPASIEDVQKRGGTLSDTLSSSGSLTITLELPHSLPTDA